MRSAASAIGTAPASLYRYVATRDELVELMADQVYGEYAYEPPSAGRSPICSGSPGRAGPSITRHPWLLDVPATGNLPGPNAVAFIEQVLAALAGVDLTGPERLETVGLFSGAVRLFAQTEISQQRSGQDTSQWQGSLAGYLLQIAAAGQHPHLAAALADQPAAQAGHAAGGGAGQGARAGRRRPAGAAVRRAMTRILTGLLPPSKARAPHP